MELVFAIGILGAIVAGFLYIGKLNHERLAEKAEDPETVYVWSVTFEEGGQTYDYVRTERELRHIMEVRHEREGTWPYKVEGRPL